MESSVDRSAQVLTTGAPVTPDHREIDPATGQQKGYVVLTPEERAKGFVRPVRCTYRHVGAMWPQHELRDLTPDEQARYAPHRYVKFERYPEGESCAIGRYWTQADLDAAGKGCGVATTMGQSIAETYARDPHFYGATFCVGCRTHLPVDQFVWDGTSDRVGS